MMMSRILLFVYCALAISCTETTRFERLNADKTGIYFNNEIIEKDSFNILHDEYMYNGGGVGVGDLNNDGFADLIFTGNKVSSKVYLNNGDLTFRDITYAFQDLSNDQWYSGVSIVDINNDGWLDVYLTATSSKVPERRKNRLWINQGVSGKGEISFEELAESYGIADDGHAVHAGFFDYDLDGDLDLYILNNIVSKAIPTNYRPKITDGTAINNDRMYRNEGNGTFTDVTKEAGIVYEGFGLGLAFGDVNKDGYPDIYVSNDYIANDILYINQGDGTFKNATRDYLSYQSRFSMGNDMADINNDGYLDLMTVDMMPEAYSRKKQTINGNSYLVYTNNEKYGYEPQYVRNMVHLHNGFRNGEMLPFSEVGQMTGLFQTEWSWSPLFADFDNDGDRDLMITNGFPKDLTDKDFTNYKAQVYGFVAGDDHMIDRIPVVKVANYAFENGGPYTFRDQTVAWGLSIPSFSNGAAFVDLDNDGDLDYVVNNINDLAFVYRNNTVGKLDETSAYLRLQLKGEGKNSLAIGAKTEVWAGGRYQYHEQFLTRGYISSVDPVVHFGLAGETIIDSIKITWPTRDRQTLLQNVQVNQMLTVEESDAKPVKIDGSLSSRSPLPFQPQDNVITYKHHEEDYVDFFQNQRIIQHKLSQIGPCMAKGDLNNDGKDDLLIGGSSEAPTSVFLFQQTRFVNASFSGLTDRKQCTESDMAIFDVDGDGDNDVVAVSGGYKNESDQEYQHFLYRNDDGEFSRHALPVPPFPASVVRSFDFDDDGDIDLFIGARVKRMEYPFAPESFVLINEGGKFTKSITLDLGMVTDAVWTDYDGDGWNDLMVAREWNSLKIVRNENGKGFKMVENKLDEIHGLWNSVVASDLDGDGDDDYVVGNLGHNHRFHVSDEMPIRLYATDIDDNTFIDPIMSAYWRDREGVMREYPVNYLDELAAQSPFFRRKFTSYTKFSYTTMDSILHRSSVPAENVFYVNSTSSFILWNDKGAFTWERLPIELQTAPIKKALISDFNQDGLQDLLLVGNDHSYDVSTGHLDANKGVLLMGRGGRKFDVVPSFRSGLVFNGAVNSLLYYDGNPSFVVAGVNRDSISVFRHVVAQQPDRRLSSGH